MLTLAVAFSFHNKATRFVKDARAVAVNALCGGLEVIDDLFPVGHIVNRMRLRIFEM